MKYIILDSYPYYLGQNIICQKVVNVVIDHGMHDFVCKTEDAFEALLSSVE